MRILTIRFKNINSLAGEHHIDFARPPFANAGVFAITGPNGAGKSTILDAITLGLYGETFRFDRPAEHVITQHADDCFSTVEFALGQEAYQASWQVRRDSHSTDTGLTTRMQLIRISDREVLADSIPQVGNRIAQLTGMNFRNFTRSMLLAQGDFAAFLNALDNERMDILEKIVGADIYADYRQEVVAKADAAQTAVDKLQHELATIAPIAPERLEAYRHDLLDYQEQHETLQHEQTALTRQLAAFDRLAALKRQVSDRQARLTDTQTRLATEQARLEQIAAAEPAAAFADRMAVLAEQTRQLQQSSERLAALQTELAHIEQQLGDQTPAPDAIEQRTFSEQLAVLDRLHDGIGRLHTDRQAATALLQALSTQIDDKTAALATVEAWLNDHSGDASLLEEFPEVAKLKKLRTELAALTQKQKALDKQTAGSTLALRSAIAALDKAEAKTIDLEQALVKNNTQLEQLLQGHDPDTLDALKAEQQERVKHFQALHDLAAEYRRLDQGEAGFFGFFKSKERVEYDPATLSRDLDSLAQEIGREENIKRVLEEAVTREALLKKMADDRIHLIAGKPCPLCGSTQHPYAKQPPALTDSKQALQDQQQKLTALIAQAGVLRKQMIAAQKDAESNVHKQTRLQQIGSRWLGLCNRLNAVSPELTIGNMKRMRQLLDDETRHLKSLVVLAVNYQNQKTDIAKTQDLLEKNRVTVLQLQAKVQQLDASDDAPNQQQTENAAALADCRQQERALTEKVLAQLALLGEKMPGKGKEDAFFDRLNARRQEYHGHSYRRNSLQQELAALEQKRQTCVADLARCDRQLDDDTQQLQTEQIIGLQLASLEKQKLIAEQQQWVTQQTDELTALQQTIVAALSATAWPELTTLQAALTLLQTKPDVERRQTALLQERATLAAQLEQDQTLLASASAELDPGLDQESLKLRLKDIAEKMELAAMECQHVERLLQDQQNGQQRYQQLLTALDVEQQRAQPYLDELAVARSEDQREFRRRVQARWAQRLLAQTNTVLEKISGRYYLRYLPDRQGLALEIEDAYQGNARRLPKTLSGGESFVVSLALALGLSELANNGQSVDSLFLDEGFGNLDAESLYTVISTLESLQTHGKTVGVISHVEAVQKRIKVQLRIVKKPNGFGELKKAS